MVRSRYRYGHRLHSTVDGAGAIQSAVRMTANLLDRLLDAAEAHGRESEPDHEVGDLRAILLSCWHRLGSDQRRAVYDEHRDLVAEWLGGDARETAAP
jgi:hypothetical protein